MSSPSPSANLFWAQLLSLMKKGEVIPIVGPDAILVEDVPGRPTLNEYLARKAEALLGLEPGGGPGPLTLHDVASRYLELEGSGEIGNVYSAVNEALLSRELPIPETLRKLARIDAFSLYVTTTFDDLLRRALDAERFQGERRTSSLAYTPERWDDLSGPVAAGATPTVYHLLGKASPLQDYVVTEEDTLEFVHSLQSAHRRPDSLMDEFRARSVLVIGSGYSDWLMRFFIRIATKDRLLLARSKTILVNGRDDASLAAFLRRFSPQTRVFRNQVPEFVDELADRWAEFKGASSSAEDPPATRRAPERPIFISYASEDRPRAARLAAALRDAGLPVWFDRPVGYGKAGLQGGVEWRPEIARQIQSASVFAAVLSSNVRTVEGRYYRHEWDQAIEAGKALPHNREFIVPICLDDLPTDAPELPPRFRDLQWLGAKGDADFGEAVRRIRDIYRNYQRHRGAEHE